MSILPFSRKDLIIASEDIHYLTYAEVQQLLHIAQVNSLKDYTLLYFMFETGARISEVVRQIKVKEIDLFQREIKLVTLKQKKKTKKGYISTRNNERTIALTEKCLNVLNLYIRQYNLTNEDLLFNFSRQRADQIIRKYAKLANLDEYGHHIHILRHSNAVYLLSIQMPITLVQKRLGHSNLATTAKYLKYNTDAEKEFLKRFEI